MFRQSKAFFSLNIEDKMAVKADENNRGFTPMHEEILDPAMQAKGDTKVSVLASGTSFVQHARGRSCLCLHPRSVVRAPCSGLFLRVFMKRSLYLRF